MAIHTVSQQPPGPAALPLIGKGVHLLKLFRDPCTYPRLLQKAYGDVVALAQGDPTSVRVFGPKLNVQVLSQPALFEAGKGKILPGLNDTAAGRLLRCNLMNMNGELHKRHRQLMQPAFHTRQVGQYHDDMVALTTLMLERWQSLARIELYAEMKQLTRSADRGQDVVWDLRGARDRPHRSAFPAIPGCTGMAPVHPAHRHTRSALSSRAQTCLGAGKRPAFSDCPQARGWQEERRPGHAGAGT